MNFKEFLFGQPKDIILKEIESYGKMLSELSKEDNYKENEKGKAKYYQQNLQATRKAYKKIKNGEDLYSTINELYLYVKDVEVKRILEKCGRFK